ncbi:Apple-like [Macleaya cordata]|uniref:Apple-like n=1 Tax=Macleaya cordata TaxID=56857 RepID=A0A200QXH4_MACCD|nr:Apple-like [Macleaya cordata]
MNDFFLPTVWAQPKYNSTLSILRFSSDGNIHVYTYYEKGILNAWEETYTLFTDSQGGADECYLPEKCGSLGICENSQCVACPTAKGLEGWSKDCKPSKQPSCNSTTVGYYKVEGVDHFLNIYNAEAEPKTPMKIEECRKKCSNDCKCAAFFYKKDSESCLLTVQLNTLKKGDDSESSKLVAYIKYTK